MTAPSSVPSPSVPGAPTRSPVRFGAGARPSGTHFWAVAVVFVTAMAFSTIPTPLYAFYRERDGFSTFWITIIFAAYAIGVIGSLFLAGHISDWFGRRPLLMAALGTEIVAALMFLTWSSLPGLILARIVTGIGVGLITATATAHLGELRASARPNAGPALAQRVSVAANMGGLALGPLIGGVLAQFVFHPLEVPYLIFLALLVISLLLVLVVPETVDLSGGRPAYRPQRVTIPQQGRVLYFTVAAGAFVAFAILGLFTSVSPGFLAGSLGYTSPLLAGSVSFAVFGSGALAQIAASSLPVLTVERQVRLGLALMATGILIVTAAVWGSNLAGFIVGGMIAGSGVGTLFKGALATAAGLAAPESRGEALAGLFLAAYIGLALPVMGIGVATLAVSLSTALLGFAVLVLLAISAVAFRLRSAH